MLQNTSATTLSNDPSIPVGAQWVVRNADYGLLRSKSLILPVCRRRLIARTANLLAKGNGADKSALRAINRRLRDTISVFGCQNSLSVNRDTGADKSALRAINRRLRGLRHHRFINTCYIALLCCLFLLAACSSSPSPTVGKTAVATSGATDVATSPPTSTPTPTPTPGPAPASYTAHTLLQGGHRPDDLTFDTQGHLLFSDFYNNTISRLNADGTVTTLLSGIDGPEGMVVLRDGTMIVAEQRTNRIISFAPGSHTPTVLRQLPGTPSTASCKDGVDGIAFDPTTSTVIVPDSPTGNVYRMSLDGKTLTLLASGIVRPVGAYVDAQGTIYVADECGGAVWTIAPGGKTTHIGGFGMPDDVVLDGHGDLLVIDLQPSIHALIRLNLATGKRETLASTGYIEPQGLIIDAHGNIFVSDDYADKIVEYEPA